MTNEQMLNLDRAREFRKTVLEDIEREVNKIPTQYGNGGQNNPKAVNVCHNILMDLRLSLSLDIKDAIKKVDNFIESL